MDHADSRRWWRLPAAALTAAALATASVPAYADADRQPGGDAPWSSTTAVPAPVSSDVLGHEAGASGALHSTAADEASSVTEYWTAERMASAIPADEPDEPARTGEPDDERGGRDFGTLSSASPELDQSSDQDQPSDQGQPPTVIAEPVPAADTPLDPQADPVTDYSDTNGKVFFRDQTDGRDYMCSGSAVSSAAKRLVVTAGHCVHGGPGGTWHANWVFAPGYDHGPGPEGTFPATSFRAFDEWITYGVSGRGFNSDVAFVTMELSDRGETVVDAVGGHGLTTGGNREFDATLFGYPVNLDAGERMWSCVGTTGAQQIDTYLFPSISGCDFGPGASGGPWLERYDDDAGLGYVRSVTSFGPAGSTEYISGPYFDERVAELYEAADGDGLQEGQ